MKTLVIGLDGACMDLIKQYVNDDKLPTFEKLMKEGSYGNLESVTPPLTIPAWNCLASGKNPGKLGCFSFVQKDYGSYNFRVYSSQVKREKCIWDILSDYGKKNFVFNVPNIITAYKVNGFMVAGFLCPFEEKRTYPLNLRNKLNSMGYEEGNDGLKFIIIGDNERSRLLKEMTENHCKLIFHFLEKDWDFGFVVFTELDGIQHRCWNKKDLILRHYQHIDRILKKILNKLDEKDNKTNLIIVSDHGFGPNKRMFVINEWLAHRGLLEVKKEKSFAIINALIRIIKGPNILKILRLLIKVPIFIPIYQKLYFRAVRTPILWDKTKAFSYGNWGTIYINLEKREPKGVVKVDEYEQLRSKIIDELQEISVKAYRKEELYHGKYLELAPDIIIQIDDCVNSVSGKVGYNKEFMEGFPQEGYHKKSNGVFIACGPNIKKNFEINARIYDITPTILHIFGIPIPEDTDGRVLKEIFTGDLAIRKIKYQKLSENKRIAQIVKMLKQRREI